MAEVIQEFTRKARTRAEKYPYDEWFDGQKRRLSVGDDFAAKPSVFRGTLYSAAKRRGLKLVSRTFDDALEIQAVAGDTQLRKPSAKKTTKKK